MKDDKEVSFHTYIPWRLRLRAISNSAKRVLARYENILTGLALLIVICLGLYHVCSIFTSSFGYNLKAEMGYRIKRL